MQDPFTGQRTFIQGRAFPSASERAALQDDHRRRLEALARLGEAAVECGLRADSDRDLVLLAEDEVSLLEVAEGPWRVLGEAIRALRKGLPIVRLEDFGFPPLSDNPLEEANPRLLRIGGGVEAWVYLSPADGSAYKFYLPRETKRIGSEFAFDPGAEATWDAHAVLGNYRSLFEKLLLIDLVGTPTEVTAVTPEGILVAKQAFGNSLPQAKDMSRLLPAELIEIPSRFLRADRDHPRLLFWGDRPYLVGDLHARNFIQSADGGLHLIDLVAASWPEIDPIRQSTVAQWLRRARTDPLASLLPTVPDSEL